MTMSQTGERQMKFIIITLALFGSLSVIAKTKCPEFTTNKSKVLLVNFDGLGASELGLKILERNISSRIKDRCSSLEVHSVTYHYGKRGAKKAYQCAKQIFDNHPNISINIFGHSFGGGKGVFNFLNKVQNESILEVENAVTFDPRGYTYRYTNPGSPYVNNFINIYQRNPLRGMKVKNTDFEIDVTGTSSHGNLPKNHWQTALKNLEGSLSCSK